MNKVVISILLIIFFLSISCSKLEYVVVQGVGQISLLVNGEENSEILKSDKISNEQKRKIMLIEDYKSYFYSYFNKKKGGIYSETTILDGEAVTYLVILSKYYEIIPKQECFWFVGCFPYLGFYSKNRAVNYVNEMEEKGYETYLRPVYAYSTLGYFEDTILSSFFHYSDYELAELIFHELFHTILFVKDEVDLNENLANYFGKEMAIDYFELTKDEISKKQEDKVVQEQLSSLIVSFADEVSKEYEKQGGKKLSREIAVKIREQKISTYLVPQAEKLCEKLGVEQSKCFPLKSKWNNASLSAFLTYEKKMDEVAKQYKKLGVDLAGYLKYIENKYKKYKKLDSEETFSSYLFDSK